jgi:AcrR family transcriptional regulator
VNAATRRRLRPRGQTRRAQILDAATKVFVENGYGAATIDLVVSRAGASKATVYSFFGGKEGLFTAIIEERAERILAALPHVGIDQVDVRTTLTEIGRRYMGVAMSPDAIGLYRLILAEGVRFPELVRTFYRIGPERVSERVASLLRAWRRHRLITVDDAYLAAVQFLDAVRGELHLRAVAGVPPDDLADAIERNVHHAVHIFWNGIRAEREARS